MQQSFLEFISANFKISVLISVIVYKIFSVLIDKLLVPSMYTLVDPDGNLQDKNVVIGGYTIEHGKVLGDIFVLLLILFIVYLLFRKRM